MSEVLNSVSHCGWSSEEKDELCTRVLPKSVLKLGNIL